MLPKLGHYHIKQEVLDLGDGSSSHKLVKVPDAQVEVWDAEHDAAGRLVVNEFAADTKSASV